MFSKKIEIIAKHSQIPNGLILTIFPFKISDNHQIKQEILSGILNYSSFS